MYADGKKVGTTPGPGGGSFLVPAAPARYRLEATTDRSPSDVHLTTKMNMTWTFGSAQPASGVRQVLPLMAMRLSPAVDQNNKAPSGCLFRIPLTVQFEPHTTGKVKKVTVEYSTNGGKTWKAAGVAREGAERFAAFLAHPKAPNAYVSLRTEVQDTAGNTASQTLINAYQLR
jgi:hypothetical protein